MHLNVFFSKSKLKNKTRICRVYRSHANYLWPINFWMSQHFNAEKKMSLFTRIHWPTNRLFIQINATIKHLHNTCIYIYNIEKERVIDSPHCSLFHKCSSILSFFPRFLLAQRTIVYILMGFSPNMNSSLRKVCDCTLGFFFSSFQWYTQQAERDGRKPRKFEWSEIEKQGRWKIMCAFDCVLPKLTRIDFELEARFSPHAIKR